LDDDGIGPRSLKRSERRIDFLRALEHHHIDRDAGIFPA
jgi:hypothetical protein